MALFARPFSVSEVLPEEEARDSRTRWTASRTRKAAFWFVIVRRSRRAAGVKDQSRYWLDVRYRSSSDIFGYLEECFQGRRFIFRCCGRGFSTGRYLAFFVWWFFWALNFGRQHLDSPHVLNISSPLHTILIHPPAPEDNDDVKWGTSFITTKYQAIHSYPSSSRSPQRDSYATAINSQIMALKGSFCSPWGLLLFCLYRTFWH